MTNNDLRDFPERENENSHENEHGKKHKERKSSGDIPCKGCFC